MKIKLLMAAALTAVISLASCGGADAKLAGELAGTWKGNATQMMNGKKDKPDKDGQHKNGGHDGADRGRADRGHQGHGDGCELTCTPTLTFVRTDGTNGGTISLSADYTVSRGVETASTATPVIATVNGIINASGTWTAKDGDEIMVSLDPAKTEIVVDTASLALTYANLTDASQDSLNAIKDRVAANITDVVKPMIAARVQRMHEFDDVKIKGNNMTLEAGHNKLNFTKQ